MVTVKHDPESEEQTQKDFRRLFDDYAETLKYKGQMLRFPDHLH